MSSVGIGRQMPDRDARNKKRKVSCSSSIDRTNLKDQKEKNAFLSLLLSRHQIQILLHDGFHLFYAWQTDLHNWREYPMDTIYPHVTGEFPNVTEPSS